MKHHHMSCFLSHLVVSAFPFQSGTSHDLGGAVAQSFAIVLLSDTSPFSLYLPPQAGSSHNLFACAFCWSQLMLLLQAGTSHSLFGNFARTFGSRSKAY